MTATNPKTQAQITREAYAVGAEKLGTKTGQALGLTHEIAELPIAGSGAKVAVGSHPALEPGQIYHCRGSTIANPQPSDIEVEAAIGVRVYDPKPDLHSKEEIVLKSTKLEQEIEGLKKTLAAILAGQNLATQNVKPIENNSEPVTETVTESTSASTPVSEPTMAELREQAKPLGIKTARMSKETLTEFISRAGVKA